MLEYVKQLVAEAGEKIVKNSFGLDEGEIRFKNEKDLVSEYDEGVENFLIAGIREKYPDHEVLGEETGRSGSSSEFCWVIDPIDGTTSFVHGQPFYSISVALRRNNETVLGIVYAPRLNEMFCAVKGEGTFLNDRKVVVSKRKELRHSVLATGFACLRAGLKDNNLNNFNRIVPRLRGIRRYGSAALDLAYVSCGYLDGFWELNLQSYDVAAGILLVQESGGVVTDFQNGKRCPERGTLATNSFIHDEMVGLLKT